MNRPRTTPPASTSQIVGEQAEPIGAPGLGCTNPQAPARRIAEHDQPEPGGRERGSDQIEPQLASAGAASAIRRVRREDHQHDQDLADEHHRHER